MTRTVVNTTMNNDLNGYQLEAFGKCFYYWCESFSVPKEAADIRYNIMRAVDKLEKKINLYHYGLVVMPEARDSVHQFMSRYIYRFNQPKLCSFEDILAQPMDEKLQSIIRQQNVLVIDSTKTTDSTLMEVLRTLRTLNENNQIAVFSLIGHKECGQNNGSILLNK